jgi:hypothetical protein
MAGSEVNHLKEVPHELEKGHQTQFEMALQLMKIEHSKCFGKLKETWSTKHTDASRVWKEPFATTEK